MLRFAKSNHIVLTLLVLVTIGSSALAGVLGLGFGVNTRIVAAIALIPGIAAATNNQLRLQNRCNWHYRKYDALKALLRKLDYGLPNNATVADVAKISDQLSELETQMTREWENSFRVMPEDLRGHPSSSGTFPERGGAREDK